MTPFVDRPDAPMPSTVLFILDVDGVLNKLPTHQNSPSTPVTDRHGRTYPMRIIDIEILDALEKITMRPNVSLAWLTTWGKDVQLLVDGLFQGRLDHGHILAERPDQIFVASDWKLRALLLHLETLHNPPIIWADDDAINAALMLRPDFAKRTDMKRLLLDPNPEVGLTLRDIEEIGEFLDTLEGAQ